jgi:tetratricopeptide (TPR) repeat protein
MRYAVARLEDLESIPGPGSLTWHPVRAHFDLRAFGCNAYTAAAAGEDVVEPHDEAGDPGHEELYFVHAGRARFSLDGEDIEAGPGTYVFVRDPAVHRHAVALEAGTTVLSFGAPPTFEPSGWEWSFRAEPLVESDPARARAILEEGARTRPDSASIQYALARLEIRQGRRDAAVAAARRALELVPAEQRDELRSDMRAHPALVDLRDEL